MGLDEFRRVQMPPVYDLKFGGRVRGDQFFKLYWFMPTHFFFFIYLFTFLLPLVQL